MSTVSWIAFKSLLKWKHSSLDQTLAHFFEDEDLTRLEQLPHSKTNPFASPLTLSQRLEAVHYSWMIPYLDTLAKPDQELLIASLDPIQAGKLRSYYQLSDTLPSLNQVAKNFLQQTLYRALLSNQKEVLPRELLPEHPLTPLLSLSKEELERLIDLLGLHDLAIELKRIVKSEQIKKIKSCFTESERGFLNALQKKKEPLSFARLNLEGWNGEKESLRTILHYRGLNRLAKTLFGSHPSFLWQLSHQLDTGRAKILQKYCTDLNNEQAKRALTDQILELIPKVSLL